MKGGYYGLKGYILQAVAALLECLDEQEWTEIKLEPGTKEDKADFILYQEGKAVRSVQVKSSILPFGKKAVEDWLEGLCTDVPEGKHELILIGEKYADKTEDYIREVNRYADRSVKTLRMDTESLIQKTNGAVLDYVRKVFPQASFRADAVFTICDRLFSALMKNGILPVTYTRTEFSDVINRTLNLFLVKENGVFSEDLTIREQIWKAMKKRFINMKAEGGRFAFDIIPSILPSGKQVEYKFTAKARLDNNEIVPLKELVSQNSDHMAVIGTGGIGKTTYLQSILEDNYLHGESHAEKRSVPLFIELYHCPADLERWSNEMTGSTNFIVRSIAAICENHYSYDKVSEGTISAIEKEFQKVPEGGRAAYILLLDGFNEVSIRHGSETRIMLGREIEAMSGWPNVRIIATSRETEYAYFAAGFRNVYLTGLTEPEIRQYLHDTECFSPAEIGLVMSDRRLLECIRIPLYLLMYASSGEKEGFDPQTSGEILYAFFHRGSEFYNLRSRAGATNTYGMDKEQLHAVLGYILPYIGWTMDEADTFYLSQQEIRDCYNKALSESRLLLSEMKSDTVLLPGNGAGKDRELAVLNSLQQEFMFAQTIRCIQNFLGLLYCSRNVEGGGTESREYAFVHHQFRDYFSAIWNRILLKAMPFMEGRTYLAEEYLNRTVWQEQKIHMLSEILMEHRNRSYFDAYSQVWRSPKKRWPEQSIAEQALECLRNSSGNMKYLTSNLLRVLLEGRQELAGLDLGELNLEGFSLFGIPCSKGLGRTVRLSAGFYGARISEQTLEPEDHRDNVIDIVYRSDRCYTFDGYGTIKCWDIRSGVLLNEWQSEIPNMYGFAPSGYLKASLDGRFLAAQIRLPEASGVKLIDVRSEDRQEEIISLDEDKRLETVAFSDDSRNLLILDQSGKLYVYDCIGRRMEEKREVRNLMNVTQLSQESEGSPVWFFTAEYSEMDFGYEYLWENPDDPNQDEEEEEEIGIPCQILTLDLKTGVTQEQRGFVGSPGTSPAACLLPERGAVLYYDGARGSLMIGIGKDEGWEVFGEITARHKDETMTLHRHPDHCDLFYIVYPEEIYLVSINKRYYCSIISRYRVEAVNALARSRGQEDNLVFWSAEAPAGRYFLLINDDGIFFEWDEKENIVRRRYNFFMNECLGLQYDQTGHQYMLIHRNNSIVFFDRETDRMKGSVVLYEPDYQISKHHFMEEARTLILVLVRLDNEKVITMHVDTGERRLLFSTTQERETVETIDSDSQRKTLLLTTQYRCCEIDLQTMEEREVAVSANDRRFVNGWYEDGTLRVVEVVHRSDAEIEAPLCHIFSANDCGYRFMESRMINELCPALYPYFIFHDNDLGMSGTEDSRGMQRFWLTEGFFLKLPEEAGISEYDMPLKPFEMGLVWHRRELRHYGEYKEGDIRIMSRSSQGTLFVRSSRTLYFARDIRKLTYEELDRALNEERGCLGGEAFWSYVIRLENGDLICSYEGDGLMRLDGSTGEMIREIPYTPGLVLWGCNFAGIDASDEVKRILRENGAVVSN